MNYPTTSDLKTDSIFGKINVQINDYADPNRHSSSMNNKDEFKSNMTSQIKDTVGTQPSQMAQKHPKKTLFVNFMRIIYGFNAIERP